MRSSLSQKPVNEQAIFDSAKSFLEQEFGVPVHIVWAEEIERPAVQKVIVIE